MILIKPSATVLAEDLAVGRYAKPLPSLCIKPTPPLRGVQMLKIYHTPGSRSVRPIWLCFELDIPAQIKRVDASYRGTPEWRAISPTGKVPAIEDGDTTICESGAILDYLLAR